MALIGGVRSAVFSDLVDDDIGIPDVNVFQSPLYQWFAGEGIGVSDGSEATTWDDVLDNITASATGSPTYRSDQEGFESVEYDGSNDGHDIDSAATFPDGNDPFTALVLVYPLDNQADQEIFEKGDRTTGPISAWRIGVNGGEAVLRIDNGDNASGGSVSQDQWITLGVRHDGSSQDLFLNGSVVDSVSQSLDIRDDEYIGRRGSEDERFYQGHISEIIVCNTNESDQAISDWHEDRLGS